MAAWKLAGLTALCGGLLAAILWLAFAPRSGLEGIAVIGDKAPEIRAELGLEGAADPDRAAVLIVSVEDWWKLRYIPDLQQVCGAACDGEVAVVRAVELSPAGSRKLLFVNLSGWPGATEEPADLSCLAEALRAEPTRLRAAAPAACAAGLPGMGGTRWILPLGLGAVTL